MRVTHLVEGGVVVCRGVTLIELPGGLCGGVEAAGGECGAEEVW